MNKINYIGAALLLLTTTVGCNTTDIFDGVKAKVDLSTPILHGTLNDRSIFKYTSIGDQITANADGVLSVNQNINETLSNSGKIDNIYAFPDQNFSVTIPVSTPDLSFSTSLPINLGENVTLKELIFSAGELQCSGTAAGGFSVTLPQITRNGAPVTLLPGQRIKLDKSYKLTLNGQSNFTLQASGSVTTPGSIAVKLTGVKISAATGFFGRRDISNINSTLTVNSSTTKFLETMDEVYLANPTITFMVNNSYNLPFLIQIKKIAIVSYTDQTHTAEVTTEIELKPETGSSRFLIVKGKNTFTLNNASTVSGNGFSKGITKNIKSISYEISAISNPTAADLPGITPATENSFSAENELSATISMELSLDGYFGNITFEEVKDADLSDIKKDEIEYVSGSYLLLTENSFPLDLDVEIFTIANKMNPDVYQALPGGRMTIPAAENNLKPGDPNLKPGIVDQNNGKILILDKQAINQLLSAQAVRLLMRASSSNIAQKQNIKLYRGSTLSYQLVVGAKAIVTLKD